MTGAISGGAWRVAGGESRSVRPEALATRHPPPATRIAILAALLLAPTALSAQVSPSPSTTLSPSALAPVTPWLLQWSPLQAPGAELGRGGVAVPRLADVMTTAAPRVGLFWTAGNPGAIAFELDTVRRAEFRGGGGRVSGDYRRPMDPGEVSGGELSAFAWQRVGAHGAAIGRASIAQQSVTGGGTAALTIEPYTASPLVPTDTGAPDLTRASALLEGAIGWRIGGWGAGVSVGYDARDSRAEHSRRGRIGRGVLPAAAVGVARALPWADVTVGAYGRFGGRAERITTVYLTEPEQVYQLEGYDEVEVREVGRNPYYRRLTRQAAAGGVSLGVTLFGAQLAAFAERGRLREKQSSAEQQNPPADRWSADATTAGAAAQRTFFGAALVTGQLRYTSAGGDATRSDLTGRIFRADDRAMRADGEIRVPVGAGWRGWGGAIGAATTYTQYRRRDPLAGLATETTAWAPEFSVELGRELAYGFAVAGGYAGASYVPTSALPAGESLGPLFQRLIAPELEYYAAPARADAAHVTARWRAPGGAALYLRGGYERVAPTASDSVPFRPTGTRSAVHATIGVVLGRL